MQLRDPEEGEREAFRREVLEGLGANMAETEELLAYNSNLFEPSAELVAHGLPLPDEPFVEAWESYASRAAVDGAFPVLRDVLVQLRFPIREGIAHDAAYRAATRRGEWPTGRTDEIRLEQPTGLQLRLEGTLAGRIPILITSARKDFETLVRAVTARNEPVLIPHSISAFMVSGYVNWDRVMGHRRRWARSNADGDWPSEFRHLAGQRALYQDRFIVACTGPYSGIDAEAMGLDPKQWHERSLEIRIGHECAHYFTRRAFGSMRNNLLDELIADYAGLVAAFGRFRSNWFLRFLGMEDYPRYRVGGRLEAYRGDPPLSDGAFSILQALVVAATAVVEAVDRERLDAVGPAQNGRLIRALTCLTLEELASAQGADRLRCALPED